ncbi:thioredoxin-related protein [Pedobacter cryoconitis]|uniref:Thioredoxin-related protein n=1 Tax=Pedobacter cryoconitis TaxID=188932 RepID=A0A7W9E0U4_9SPHI|nr:thioredoxin family protein [Pedobacter cryoconitis]MBB5638333.1 thioredoxin-related protein [Pedobacter cryoconitis]
MKVLLITFLSILAGSLSWMSNFTQAQQQAKSTHQQILVNFSGSDWCGPCIRLRKEILESEVFETYAKAHLVLVRADFPRQKKNQLSAEQIKLNEALAEKYNPDGKFPYTLLLDENGEVLKSWDGYPNETPEKFIQEITSIESAK